MPPACSPLLELSASLPGARVGAWPPPSPPHPPLFFFSLFALPEKPGPSGRGAAAANPSPALLAPRGEGAKSEKASPTGMESLETQRGCAQHPAGLDLPRQSGGEGGKEDGHPRTHSPC